MECKKDALFSIEEVKESIKAFLPDKAKLSEDKNLIEQGISSLQIMKIVTDYKKRGSGAKFADLIGDPYVKSWHRLLNVAKKKKAKKTAGENTFVSNDNKDTIEAYANYAGRYEAYDLTPVQYSYWVGRRDSQTLGGVGCHAYIELDGKNIDKDRLNEAYKKLQLYHPMLHTAFTDDGKQVEKADFKPKDIDFIDLSGIDEAEREDRLLEIRNNISHRKLKIEEGETSGVTLVKCIGDSYKFIYDVDLLVADVLSFQKILADLARLYKGEELPDGPDKFSFKKYLEDNADLEGYEEAKKYWDKELANIADRPKLPVKKDPALIKNTRFNTRTFKLTKDEWESIKGFAKERQLTPAMVLLSAYATVLERWSETSEFNINLPIFNRKSDAEWMNNVVSDFSDILILDVDLNEPKSFEEQTRTIQNKFHERMQYCAYPGVEVVRGLAKEGKESTVVFACNLGNPLPGKEAEEAFGELAYMLSQTPQVWIDFQIFDLNNGGIFLKFDSVDEIFPEGVLCDMIKSLERLLRELAKEEALWSLPPRLTYANEVAEKTYKANITENNFPETTMVDGFLTEAEKNPDNPAIINGSNGEIITYKKLKEKALKLAACLVEKGVRPADKVAISLPKGELQIIAALGVQLAGAAYVPVSLNQPLQRRTSIYEDASIIHTIISKECEVTIPAEINTGKDIQKTTRIYIEDLEKASCLKESLARPEMVAYIIFTSGSTGKPKGVVISHKAAMNTIFDINKRYNISESDRTIAISSLDFDLSVYDIFGPLNAGGAVVTITDDDVRSPEIWKKIVESRQVTVWNTAPAILDMFVTYCENEKIDKNFLRQALVSGDWIAVNLPERYKRIFKGAEFTSLGGATECSIWSNYYDTEGRLNDWTSIPYGRPLSGQLFKILDRKGRNCPPWVMGELVIEGKGVAEGYINNKEQTEAHFFVDEGLRAYKTGDLGRFREESLMEFMGRADFLVKVRGHRIEIGEIEYAISGLSYVDKTLVAAKRDADGNNHLIAYVVLNETNDKERAKNKGGEYIKKIENDLKKSLPSYMVPALYVFLDELPKTANGKVDRKALLAMEAYETGENEGFDTEDIVELDLLNILADLLGVKSLSIEDEFFSVGGDSLTAVHLAARIKSDFSIPFTLAQIFENTVFKDMAEEIKNALVACGRDISSKDGISKKDASLKTAETIRHDEGARYEKFPLSDVQRAYFLGRQGLFGKKEITTHYYFEIGTDKLDTGLFEEAVNVLISKQDMLHSEILSDGNTQIVIKDYPRYIIDVADCASKSDSETEAVIAELREEMAHKRFTDADIFPMEIKIIKEKEDKFRINLCFDNIIFDGFSVYLFFDKVDEIYRDLLCGREITYNGPAVTFRDYMIALDDIKRGISYSESKDYWLDRAETICAAPDLGFLPVKDDEINFVHLEKVIDKDKWEEFKEFLKNKAEITPAVFLMSVFSEVLAVWSADDSFSLNLTRFNRRPLAPDIDEVIGDFTSLTILEVDCSKGDSFIARAKNLSAQLIKDLDKAEYDGAVFEREVALRKEIKGAIFPVVFTSALGLDVAAGDDKSDYLFANRLYSGSETSQVYLDNQVSEEGGALVVVWDLAREAFPLGMYDEMFEAYSKLIDKIIKDPACIYETCASLLDVKLPAAVAAANNTDKPLELDTLQGIIRKAFYKFAENPAIIEDEKIYTYEALERESLLIAEKIKKAVRDNTSPVAIISKKSADQLIEVAGIVRSGHPYIPMGIDYPYDRIKGICDEAGVEVVVTDKKSLEKLAFDYKESDLKFIVYEKADDYKNNLSYDLSEEEKRFKTSSLYDTAYIIYTSGSTGKPKGVEIANAACTNTIFDINDRFNIGESDRAFAISNLNFDLSVYDIFGMFAAGGGVVVCPEDKNRDSEYWKERIIDKKVTLWNSVPAFMRMLSEAGTFKEKEGKSVRNILMSGDWIGVDLPPVLMKIFKNADIYSLGGATECSIWSNFYKITEKDKEKRSIPYGKPLSNQQFRILDKHMNPRPVYVPGDMYITGAGLAKGYFNAPDKTREAFIDHNGERLYKTGDKGRYLYDGNIEFLGRSDFQVKINGYRIELGEIEESIKESNKVGGALCVVSDNNKLHAFVTPKTEEEKDCLRNAYQEDFAKKILQKNGIDIESFDAFYEILNGESVRVIKDLLKSFRENDIKVAANYKPLIALWEERESSETPDINIFADKLNTSCNKSLSEIYDIFISQKELISKIITGDMEAIKLFEGDSKLTPLWLSSLNPAAEVSYEAVYERLKPQVAGGDVKAAIIGSRSGYLAEFLCDRFKGLIGDKLSITWMDNSTYFYNKVKEKIDGNIEYMAFDMDKLSVEQDVAEFSFDIVIADNTLHRAENIFTSLKAVKSLLKPAGELLFIEQTENNAFVINSAGILEEGFSKFTDGRKLPLYSEEEWREVLRKVNLTADTLISKKEGSKLKTAIFAARRSKEIVLPDVNEVYADIKKKLAAYMLPESITVVEDFPVTANGKIDRKLLIKLSDNLSLDIQKEIILPETEAEKTIYEAIKSVLSIDNLSIDDEFFSVGGDSLTAISLMNKLNDSGKNKITLRDIFSLQTVRKIAEKLNEFSESEDDDGFEMGEI